MDDAARDHLVYAMGCIRRALLAEDEEGQRQALTDARDAIETVEDLLGPTSDDEED